MRRSIYDTSGEAVLEASFSDLLLQRSRKYIDHATLSEMVSVVSLILVVDAERMLRRVGDQDTLAKVTIRIIAGDLPVEMRCYCVEEIGETLAKRTVAIQLA